MKKLFIVLCILVFTGLILLIILDGAFNTSKSNVSANINEDTADAIMIDLSKLKEDYLLMWSIIENEYPAYQVIETTTGVSLDDLKREYMFELNHVTNPVQFLEEIVFPCLEYFNSIEHMQAIDKDLFLQHYIYDYDADDPKEQYINKRLNNPRCLELYQVQNDYEIKTTSDETSELARSDNNLQFKKFDGYNAGYIKINSMIYNEEQGKQIEDFLYQIEQSDYEHCIIDIRGNSGGSEMLWKQYIVAPNISEDVSANYFGLIKSEYVCEYIELAGCEVTDIQEFPQDKIIEEYAYLLKDMKYFTQFDDTVYAIREQPIFNGKFWLLVDKNVYSAADKFANFCAETGFATIVGIRTGGDGVGLTPLPYVLPNSGACFQFSPTLGLNPDGTINAVSGTQPDIDTSHDDALSICLQKIREEY